MPNPERPHGEPTPNKPVIPEDSFAIIVTPGDKEGVVFSTLPDGRPTMQFTGEVSIFSTKEMLPEGLLKAGTDAARTNPQKHATDAVSDAHSASGEPSRKESRTDTPQSPEDENRRISLTGNVVYEPQYKERKSGKRIADFVLATNPTDDDPGYVRVRAFDKVADRVNEQVHKGMTNVEVTAYGKKHWNVRKKAKDGTFETRQVEGYYAGFVKVPQRYRTENKAPTSEGDKPSS